MRSFRAPADVREKEVEPLLVSKRSETRMFAAVEDQLVEDPDASWLLELDSVSAQDLWDPTSRGVYSRRSALLERTLLVFMKNFKELITQYDASTTNFLKYITQLANISTGHRLLEEKRDVTSLANAG